MCDLSHACIPTALGSVASPFWQAHDQLLRKLAEEDGLSASQAAEVIGVTKNSVIGRAKRADIRWKRRPKWMDEKPKYTWEFPPTGRCVYPHGHPNEDGFRFCGDEVVEVGCPYCAEHFLLTHKPVDEERRAA